MSDETETYGTGLSLTKTAVILAVVVALFAWGVAAAEYAAEAEGWTSVDTPDEDASPGGLRRNRSAGLRLMIGALLAFLWNGVVQIPNAPWVAWFALTNRWWIVVLFLLAELAIAGGAFLLRKLDAELHGKTVRESERPVRPQRRKTRRPARRPPPGYG
ncbi:hypothetical protein [Alienimonas californiensis]|uniref:Uncharacterized protein n=1 Tax=Alienimonas californiensis TaxID=2527989 RepID=A0A517P661_9PLAN|nr:hypothetical protein [Alienimonas californiensis]QDT14857.1 hypothetical protein CA12_09370 [Alienimonas californiensis]